MSARAPTPDIPADHNEFGDDILSMMSTTGDTTELLRLVAGGDARAEAELLPRVYQDLRSLASGYLRRERPGHSLQPTDLIHEVYLRLLHTKTISFRDRPHFFRVAASAMRRILVDHARAREAQKRGGRPVSVVLEDVAGSFPCQPDQVLDLDRALQRLALLDERQSKIVELRFFAGLSEEEIALVMDLSPRTVKREWAMARAWLFDEMRGR